MNKIFLTEWKRVRSYDYAKHKDINIWVRENLEKEYYMARIYIKGRGKYEARALLNLVEFSSLKKAKAYIDCQLVKRNFLLLNEQQINLL